MCQELVNNLRTGSDSEKVAAGKKLVDTDWLSSKSLAIGKAKTILQTVLPNGDAANWFRQTSKEDQEERAALRDHVISEERIGSVKGTFDATIIALGHLSLQYWDEKGLIDENDDVFRYTVAT
ncbi:hypothetical protein HYFRA_00007356 [Hymenoscyphus fraxineus]|uniref:Uncharacterized protein n=1 Tax=Hymenoscyphus fraxineus TaxID=746836 RepID=A0A9N9PPW1_9HELO|nr:hypothetical protein HYFRA_00007356 [Hymenoscyphus fraxineus]